MISVAKHSKAAINGCKFEGTWPQNPEGADLNQHRQAKAISRSKLNAEKAKTAQKHRRESAYRLANERGRTSIGAPLQER